MVLSLMAREETRLPPFFIGWNAGSPLARIERFPFLRRRRLSTGGLSSRFPAGRGDDPDRVFSLFSVQERVRYPFLRTLFLLFPFFYHSKCGEVMRLKGLASSVLPRERVIEP